MCLYFLIPVLDESTCSAPSIQLMEPEIALYWRIICRKLHQNAQVSFQFTNYSLLMLGTLCLKQGFCEAISSESFPI